MVAFSLLLTVLPVVIVVFVVAYVAKNKAKEDEESMIRHLYTYLVLFATLMMVIGGGISIFMATADLVSPSGYYQSYSDYQMMRTSEKEGGGAVAIDDDELREQYELYVSEEKERIQVNAKNQIIKSLGFIIIPLPIFIYFNRMRKKIVE